MHTEGKAKTRDLNVDPHISYHICAYKYSILSIMSDALAFREQREISWMKYGDKRKEE